MIFTDCLQGSSEWFDARSGVITASKFEEVITKLKSGEYSSGAQKYAKRLALERFAEQRFAVDEYQTYAMRRGMELEHDARLVHEGFLGTFVQQSGFVCTEDRKFGYSTDGLIDDNGMAEYKCFMDPDKLFDIYFANAIDMVMAQVQGGMWITGRDWCDFVVYCPELANKDMDFVCHRIYRNDRYIHDMEAKLLAFDALVERHVAELRQRQAQAIADNTKRRALLKATTPQPAATPNDEGFF